ncbi:MAG: translocation and assembly module protein TamB, partial [Paraburkholderia sp.]|nr:translocation and assembly module protein TamB [Paraburkholderia sp.]
MSARRFAALASLSAAFALPPGEASGRPDDDAARDSGGQTGAGGGGGQNGGNAGAPLPRRGRSLWKALAWAIVVLVLIVGLIAGVVYGVLATERGTAYAWRAAVRLLDGKLAGKLEGGTLASGVRFSDVSWRGSDGTTLKVDRIGGQWALQGFGQAPRRFVVDYLHIGNVDMRIVPSHEPSTPMTLPENLELPLGLEIRDLRVDKLTLHEGTSTSEFSRLQFHGRSDGRHHEAAIERLDTPFGAVSAEAKLDGVRPFALSGDVGYSGKVNGEDVQVSANLTGSLEALTAEVVASGMKLTGRAHVEATPFAPVPLQRVTLAFDHVNPQAFAPGAPFADLAVRAQLQPVPGGAAGVPAALAASTAPDGALASGPAAASAPKAGAQP